MALRFRGELFTMAKAGDSYRDLVGTVASALDPSSIVRTEQWIEGPDGERDMDVEVRGYGTATAYGSALEATAIGRKGQPLTHLDASIQQLR